MYKFVRYILIGFAAAIVCACAYFGATHREGKSFTGLASVYSEDSETASGRPFDKTAMTAAHRTLPFGTRVRVTRGDKSVIVTINDRGPFVKDRVLDLSAGAAAALGLEGVQLITAQAYQTK